jgi:HAD superfamily hydrolase (TIGR01458 family)
MLPLLIDLDGVLRIGSKPAEYLNDFFDHLVITGRKACIISNTTLLNAEEIKKFFDKEKISLLFPLMTASDATYLYSKSRYKKVAVYSSDLVKNMFVEMLDYENPEAVIVGDMGKNWTYEILNDIFRKVKDGAGFIAMQKNKFWKTPEDGLLLDAGAFVKAIEYSTNKEATLIGKPSPIYFQTGLEKLDVDKESEFIMLGDDLETDIKGANDIGAKSILIYTGKTSKPVSPGSEYKPDFEADNLLDVIEILKKV